MNIFKTLWKSTFKIFAWFIIVGISFSTIREIAYKVGERFNKDIIYLKSPIAVEKGNTLDYRGLRIGKILKTDLTEDANTLMTAYLKKNTKISVDSRFEISSALLGKYIKITPGTSADYYNAGDTIPVIYSKEDNPTFTDVIKEVSEILSETNAEAELTAPVGDE